MIGEVVALMAEQRARYKSIMKHAGRGISPCPACFFEPVQPSPGLLIPDFSRMGYRMHNIWPG